MSFPGSTMASKRKSLARNNKTRMRVSRYYVGAADVTLFAVEPISFRRTRS
jgi:hypothetical protein